MTRGKITVVIVEEQQIVMKALCKLFEYDDDLEVVACVNDGAAAVDVVKHLHPQVIVIDACLPHVDGMEATRMIKNSSPDMKVIAFTDRNADSALRAALEAGVDGYCRRTSLRDLPMAVKVVADGATWFDPTLREFIGSQPTVEREVVATPQQVQFGLSASEVEVLRFLVRGASNAQIANSMKIAPAAVRAHIRTILEKVMVDERAQAAIKVMRERL